MDSNVHSQRVPAGLEALAAVDDLAGQDLATLADAEAAGRVLALRVLLERLEGQWPRELAARGVRDAAGAEEGIQEASTASLGRTARVVSPPSATPWRCATAAGGSTATPKTGRRLRAAHGSTTVTLGQRSATRLSRTRRR